MSSSARIKFLGHSTFLLTTESNRKVLIDPWVAHNPACPSEAQAVDSIDFMLITHSHFDHFQDAVALAKAHSPRIACILEIGLYLGAKQVENVVQMNKGGTVDFDGIRATMVDARHSSSVIEEDGRAYSGGEAAGFVVTLESGYRIYHAGDTSAFSDMGIIADLYEPDLCILPIGDLFTMGPREAAYACKLLRAKRVIPMHYGTFPALTGTPDDFRRELEGQEVRLDVMQPGETLVLQTG